MGDSNRKTFSLEFAMIQWIQLDTETFASLSIVLHVHVSRAIDFGGSAQ